MASTSYIVVACTSDKRWFDLDAERTAYADITLRKKGGRTADDAPLAGPKSETTRGMSRSIITSDAGAPPLDCWIDGDPWTQTPPPEADAVSRCQFLLGDVFHHMATIPDHSVDLIVTSPPFLALRSYLPADHPDKGKEIGSEATPAAFLSTLLALTREWRRILAPHGSICVELGDTYSSTGGIPADAGQTYHNRNNDIFDGGQYVIRTRGDVNPGGPGWPLAKSLCLIPSLYAGSLAYGHNLLDPTDVIDPWRIRNLIVWHRPNPPVGALGDKVRPSTSYITTACVSDKRWFDLDAERTELRVPEAATPEGARMNRAVKGLAGESRPRGAGGAETTKGMMSNPAGAPPLDCWVDGDDWTNDELAPRTNTHRRTAKGVDAVPRSGKSSDRGGNWSSMPELGETAPAPPLDAWFGDDCGTHGDVWTIPTQPYKGAHYATYPIALPRRLINLMCPREVCVVCGEPRRRIVGDVDWPDRQRDAVINDGGSGVHGDRCKPDTTLGWTDCGCEIPRGVIRPATATRYRRGLVLDPFCGSGTTLAAAAESGRDAIGIDLDERNLWLIRERVGLFLEEVS